MQNNSDQCKNPAASLWMLNRHDQNPCQVIAKSVLQLSADFTLPWLDLNFVCSVNSTASDPEAEMALMSTGKSAEEFCCSSVTYALYAACWACQWDQPLEGRVETTLSSFTAGCQIGNKNGSYPSTVQSLLDSSGISVPQWAYILPSTNGLWDENLAKENVSAVTPSSFGSFPTSGTSSSILSPTSVSTSSYQKTLSAAIIAGIALGATAVLLFILLCLYIVWRCRTSQRVIGSRGLFTRRPKIVSENRKLDLAIEKAESPTSFKDFATQNPLTRHESSRRRSTDPNANFGGPADLPVLERETDASTDSSRLSRLASAVHRSVRDPVVALRNKAATSSADGGRRGERTTMSNLAQSRVVPPRLVAYEQVIDRPSTSLTEADRIEPSTMERLAFDEPEPPRQENTKRPNKRKRGTRELVVINVDERDLIDNESIRSYERNEGVEAQGNVLLEAQDPLDLVIPPKPKAKSRWAPVSFFSSFFNKASSSSKKEEINHAPKITQASTDARLTSYSTQPSTPGVVEFLSNKGKNPVQSEDYTPENPNYPYLHIGAKRQFRSKSDDGSHTFSHSRGSAGKTSNGSIQVAGTSSSPGGMMGDAQSSSTGQRYAPSSEWFALFRREECAQEDGTGSSTVHSRPLLGESSDPGHSLIHSPVEAIASRESSLGPRSSATRALPGLPRPKGVRPVRRLPPIPDTATSSSVSSMERRNTVQ